MSDDKALIALVKQWQDKHTYLCTKCPHQCRITKATFRESPCIPSAPADGNLTLDVGIGFKLEEGGEA